MADSSIPADASAQQPVLPTVQATHQHAAGSSGQPVKTEQYEYGMKLDIHHPVTKYGSNYATQCGAVPAHMYYDDSQGQHHDLAYMVQGQGCNGS